MSAEALSGKGKKASDRLDAISAQTEGIARRLQSAPTALASIIQERGTEQETKQNNAVPKKRSAVEGAPDRIEFMEYGLLFYIDFTFAASESEGLVNVEGCIVYGVSRPLCFAECIFPKKEAECKNCDRVSRCDRLEDKPLVQFSINVHGIIRSSGKLDDQWRIHDTSKEDRTTAAKSNKIMENEKTLRDLHYRALDHIWKDALDWTNENILP